MNQHERIFTYCQGHHGITQAEALRDLGIMRLGARIFEMKRSGYQVASAFEEGINRFGEPIRYKRYFVHRS